MILLNNMFLIQIIRINSQRLAYSIQFTDFMYNMFLYFLFFFLLLLKMINRTNILRRKLIDSPMKMETSKDGSSQQKQIVLNKMLKQIKILLSKTLLLRQIESSNIDSPQALIQNYRSYQKSIDLDYFKQITFDISLFKIFVFKMLKELTFWKTCMNCDDSVHQQIEKIVLQQKLLKTQNITIVYLQTLNKILSKNNQLISKIITRINTLKQQKQEQTLILQKQQNKIKQQVIIYRNYLQYENKKMINCLYNKMMKEEFDYKINQVIYKFDDSQNNQYNAQRFFRKQIKRNRKVHSDILQYERRYKCFLKNAKYLEYSEDNEKELETIITNKNLDKKTTKQQKSIKSIQKYNDESRNKLSLPLLLNKSNNPKKEYKSLQKHKNLEKFKQNLKISRDKSKDRRSFKIKFIINNQVHNPHNLKLRL